MLLFITTQTIPLGVTGVFILEEDLDNPLASSAHIILQIEEIFKTLTHMNSKVYIDLSRRKIT